MLRIVPSSFFEKGGDLGAAQTTDKAQLEYFLLLC
jgi:hypothetical protein